jgi:hypothetical protein
VDVHEMDHARVLRAVQWLGERAQKLPARAALGGGSST